MKFHHITSFKENKGDIIGKSWDMFTQVWRVRIFLYQLKVILESQTIHEGQRFPPFYVTQRKR